MAKIFNGILGLLSGRIGNVSYYKAFDQGIVRSQSGKYEQKTPGLMTEQRLKYKLICNWYLSIPDIWKSNFIKSLNNKLNAFAYFVQVNISKVLPTGAIIYYQLTNSISSLPSCNYSIILNPSKTALIFTRLTPVDYDPSFSANDIFYMLHYVTGQTTPSVYIGPKRSVNVFTVDISHWGLTSGKIAYLYVAFLSSSGSNFQQIEKTIIR